MYGEQNLNLSNEQLRSVVIESMKGTNGGQWANLRRQVLATAIKMGLAEDSNAQQAGQFGRVTRMYSSGGDEGLTDADYGRVISIFWDLVIEGVLRPGLLDGVNNNLPFFHITERGKVAIEKGDQTPYDPDSYLKRIQRDVPDLDGVIITYLNEALLTFRIGCLISSTIALGCASEKALLLLIAAYAEEMPEKTRTKFKEATDGKMVKRQFDALQKFVDSDLRSVLPGDLQEGLNIGLTSLFEFIRVQRNDAGHPTGKLIEREMAYANLVVFPSYVKKVYGLISWLKANPRT